MAFIDPYEVNVSETRRQRWGLYFAIVLIVASFFIATFLRDNALFATVPYNNVEAGIRANYPSGWLIDTSDDYIFRVRDMSRAGFKTTIQVAAYPFSQNMSARNVFDDLALQRALLLPNYKQLLTRTAPFRGGEPATINEFHFVFNDPNPFQESIPTVVLGQDVLVVRSGQAILITFLADQSTYLKDIEIFERFLSTLEF